MYLSTPPLPALVRYHCVLCVLDRSGLISLEDVRMYLGEDFKEEEVVRNMRAISCRDDGQVFFLFP